MGGYTSAFKQLVVDAGELRHIVTIQKPSGAGDSFGQSVAPIAWDFVRMTRAAIFTAGGRETSDAAQIISDVSHVVKIRWTSDLIKPGYRLLVKGRFFTVSYVENVLERDRVLLLYCREIDGGGA